MKKLTITLLAVLCLGLFAAAQASADPIGTIFDNVELRHTGTIYGRTALDMHFPTLDDTTAYAGSYQLEIDFQDGNGGQFFNGYCVEDAESSTSFQDYTLYYASSMADKYKKAAWIYRYGGGSNVNTQVAIWEVMLGSDGDLDDSTDAGDFYMRESGFDDASAAQGLVNSANSIDLGIVDYTGIYLAISDGGATGDDPVADPQDYIVYIPPTPGEEVPIPGAVWLLGSGLLGLVGLRKRAK